MTLFFTNCAPKLPPERAHSETPLADEAKQEILQSLEQSLAGRRDQLRFLRGYIRARLKLRGQTQRFEGAFFLKLKNVSGDNDARFRLEVLDDFANERLLIFSDGKTLFWKEKGANETLQIDLKNPADDSKAAKKARKFIPRLFFETDALGLFAGIFSNEMFDFKTIKNIFKTAEGYLVEGVGGRILLGEQKNILEISLSPQDHGYRYRAWHFVKVEKKGARQNPRLGTETLYQSHHLNPVSPAKAGVHTRVFKSWIPTCVGKTGGACERRNLQRRNLQRQNLQRQNLQRQNLQKRNLRGEDEPVGIYFAQSLELPLEIFWKDQRSKSELVIEYQTIEWTDFLPDQLFSE